MPRCPMPYTALRDRLFAKAAARRIPIDGSLELTHRCNFNCVHCYVNLPAGDGAARRSELTFDEVCHLLDDMAAAGTLWLLITGGEVLLRRDFADIYRYAKHRGFIITIFTNGAMITERIADLFAELPPFRVEITLYGGTKATFDAVTRTPGAWEKTLRGIDLLVTRGVPLKLKAMVMKPNAHELPLMRRIAAGLGLEFSYDLEIQPRIDGSKAPCALRLSPTEIVAVELADGKRGDEWVEFLATERGAADERPGDDLFLCGAGLTSFNVDPGGHLTMCLLHRKPGFDLRRGSFREGWDDFLYRVRHRKRSQAAHVCDGGHTCNSCPGWSQLETGDEETPVDYACEVAHARGAAFAALAAERAAVPLAFQRERTALARS
ncbi:MAG: radical SAM protein [Chloroflexi bacterium]|nr:radical SAM protein [Chloroflexota bacterium]